MKILVIGDFHGKFPVRLRNRLKKEKFDLVVSLGDYLPWEFRNIFFKYCYGTDIPLWEVVGKKKYKAGQLKDLKKAKKVLEFLDKNFSNIISITGNVDRTRWKDAHRMYNIKGKRHAWNWAEQDFFSQISSKLKNIKFFDWSYVKFGEYIFIGYPISSFPGHIQSEEYRKQRRKLDSLFKKFKKENKNGKVIFVSHNLPYETKLDKITSKEADKKAKGKHFGSKLVRRVIEKYQPVLNLAGHIHENPGKDKLGKTIVVNPGAVIDGRAAIIDLSKKKPAIKFIK